MSSNSDKDISGQDSSQFFSKHLKNVSETSLIYKKHSSVLWLFRIWCIVFCVSPHFYMNKKKHNNISSYTYTYTTQKYVRMLTGLIYVKINQFMPCIFYVNANFFPSFAFVMSNFWFFIHFFVSCLLFFCKYYTDVAFFVTHEILFATEDKLIHKSIRE